MTPEEQQAAAGQGFAQAMAMLEQLASGGGTQRVDSIEALLGVDPSATVYWGQTPGRRYYSGIPEDPRVTQPQERLKTVGELFGNFYKWDERTLRERQYELYVAGYYGDIDPGDIGWGQQNDRASYQAWQGLVVDASRYYAVGKKLTPRDVLNLAKQRAGLDPDGGDDGSSSPTYAQLSDPAALAKEADTAAKKVLGRGATAEEKRLFASLMHSKQRQQAMQVRAGQQKLSPEDRTAEAERLAAGITVAPVTHSTNNGITDVVSVSPEAQAEEFARSQDPVRADARKIVEKFEFIADAFRKGAV